jgi:hypothetical protein
MARALGLAVALVLLSAAPASALSEPSGDLVAGSEETVLRLRDLPPGYEVTDESRCRPFAPGKGTPAYYASWLLEHRPEGCSFGYERLFRVPGLGPAPSLVVAETINTPSEEAAIEGLEIFLRLVAEETRWESGGTVAITPAGPPATLFHFQREFRGGSKPASLLLWRHGKLIAAMEAAGTNPPGNDQAALHYAQAQQRRLEAPSPYTEAERDDVEVRLDDPGLKLPVYWLGRTFAPGGALPPIRLRRVVLPEEKGLPGVKLILGYDGFNLETWTRQSWKRFQGSFFGKLNRPPCTRTTSFEWGQGRALISAGYRRRTFEGGCPKFPPTRYWAAARVGGVVIGVNQTTCRCLSPGFGPYSSSLRGMKTLLRGLTLRPKPAYRGAA